MSAKQDKKYNIRRLMRSSALVAFLLFFNIGHAWSDTNKPVPVNNSFFTYKWQPNHDYIYRVNLQDITLAGMLAQPGNKRQEIRNETGFKANLILHCYSRSSSGIYSFGARLSDITDIRLVLQGNNLASNKEVARVLENSREVIVNLDQDGRLTGIKHFLNNDPLYTRFIAVLAGELQTVVKSGAAKDQWTADETDYAGDALAEYTVSERARDKILLKKRKDYYIRLFVDPEGRFDTTAQSNYEISLEKKGYIQSLQGSKHIVSESNGEKMLEADTSISIMLDHIAATSLKKLNSEGAVDYDFQNTKENEKARRQILMKKAGSLGMTTFLSWADQFDKGLVPDPKERFNMKLSISARLELEPRLADKIKEYMLTKPLKTETRRMLLSVLVYTGTIEAQQAIVQILESPFIQKDPEYYKLLQSATFLQKPATDEIMDFYLKKVETAPDHNIRFASMYTTGALINNLWKNRKTPKCEAYNERFIKNLSPEKPYNEQYAMLFGIRNTKLPENIEVVAPYLKSKNGMVRRAAIRSLGRFPGSKSREMIMSMITDQDSVVKNSAFQSLLEHPLSRRDMEEIGERVKDGTLVQTTDTMVLMIEKRYARKYPAIVQETLEAMLARGMSNKDAEIKTKQLLEAVKALNRPATPLLKPQFQKQADKAQAK